MQNSTYNIRNVNILSAFLSYPLHLRKGRTKVKAVNNQTCTLHLNMRSLAEKKHKQSKKIQ